MSLIRRTGLARSPRPRRARGMRTLATAMLAGMAALFLVANASTSIHPAWGFVRAFAEAALVGGLADWFAVTALFRHPLGLPIPHTAIIPRNKDRIGDTLAQFLRTISSRPRWSRGGCAGVDVAGAVGRFLARPPGGEGRLREGGSRLLADMLEALDQERLGGMVKSGVVAAARSGSRSRLCSARRSRRRSPTSATCRSLDSHRHLGRPHARRERGHDPRHGPPARRLDPAAGRARREARRRDHRWPAAAQHRHGGRSRTIRCAPRPRKGSPRFARDLQHDPETRRRSRLEERDRSTTRRSATGSAGSGRRAAPACSRARATRKRRWPAGSARRCGNWARRCSRSAAQRRRSTSSRAAPRSAWSPRYGDGIVTLVSETIRGWDARTITGRLENAVGRDLQYIRINGTLVGGLVGLLIHAAEMWTCATPCPSPVIPGKAGSQRGKGAGLCSPPDPGFAGMTKLVLPAPRPPRYPPPTAWSFSSSRS